MINTDNVKLLGALQTIKDECITHNSCIDCPLRVEGLNIYNALEYAERCSLKRFINPSHWELKYKAIYKKKGELIKENGED